MWPCECLSCVCNVPGAVSEALLPLWGAPPGHSLRAGLFTAQLLPADSFVILRSCIYFKIQRSPFLCPFLSRNLCLGNWKVSVTRSHLRCRFGQGGLAFPPPALQRTSVPRDNTMGHTGPEGFELLCLYVSTTA